VPHLGRAIEHQYSMPIVPRPYQLPTMEEYHAALLLDPRCPARWRPFLEVRTRPSTSPLDMRPTILPDFFEGLGPVPATRPKYPELSTDRPRQAFWIRTRNPLPDDPVMHAAVLAYASDYGLISTAKGHVNIQQMGVIASLDHTVWFHSPFRADEWLLYYVESNRAADGRGIAFGMVFQEDGTLVATVAQEAVVRLATPRQRSKV